MFNFPLVNVDKGNLTQGVCKLNWSQENLQAQSIASTQTHHNQELSVLKHLQNNVDLSFCVCL